MLTYNFEWKKDGKAGNFKVNAMSDVECVKIGNQMANKFGAEVTDYYLVAPSEKGTMKEIEKAKDIRKYITKRARRATKQIALIKDEHGDSPGKTHTYFGGQRLGYWQGRLSAYEDILEELEELEQAKEQPVL